MGVKEKVIIIICLIIIGVTCYRGRKEKQEKQEKQEEQERQNEELVAAYPEQIKAYLKEKYGREFCVNPRWRGVGGNRGLLYATVSEESKLKVEQKLLFFIMYVTSANYFYKIR